MEKETVVGIDWATKEGDFSCYIEGEYDEDGVLTIHECITVPRLIVEETP